MDNNNLANGNGGKSDDGSLAFLNIPRDENSRSFNCKDVSQSKLVNTSFWLVDFLEDVPTRISQYLANLYLAYFMHWVNEELKVDATEYADDIVFFSDSKERLRGVFARVRCKLEDELKLRVKDNWQIFPIATNRYANDGRGLDYVGYQFFRHQTLMRKSIKKRFCKEAKRAIRKGVGEKKLKMRISSWIGWASHCNGRHLLQKTGVYDKIKTL